MKNALPGRGLTLTLVRGQMAPFVFFVSGSSTYLQIEKKQSGPYFASNKTCEKKLPVIPGHRDIAFHVSLCPVEIGGIRDLYSIWVSLRAFYDIFMHYITPKNDKLIYDSCRGVKVMQGPFSWITQVCLS